VFGENSIMRSLITFNENDYVNEDEMDRACSTHTGYWWKPVAKETARKTYMYVGG
jgi:hypothetical protein